MNFALNKVLQWKEHGSNRPLISAGKRRQVWYSGGQETTERSEGGTSNLVKG